MIDHSQNQTDLPITIQLLNISMNMARIAGWIESSYDTHSELVKRFMEQTENYLNDITEDKVSRKFLPTLRSFKREFFKMKQQAINEQNRKLLAERVLTWADILQLRAKLASEPLRYP